MTRHVLFILTFLTLMPGISDADLERDFRHPPDSARPGVYWYFMDGNQDRDEMIADLHAMKDVGIGSVLFLEVNIGVPTGPVSFMSDPWQENIVHAIKATQRLGMEFILGTGPGWSGSGGSWVRPEDSMQHLVGSSTKVKGPIQFDQVLPVAGPHTPNHFAGMNEAHKAARNRWFRDVAVLAFPTPSEGIATIGTANSDLVNIKTLKDVRPYSIRRTNILFVMPQADYPKLDPASVIDAGEIIDLTSKMNSDGKLSWKVPAGDWTIMRFVSRSTGQTTRPAPRAGHGFECDKFSADAYRRHWDSYQGRLIEKLGPLTSGKGLTTIHLDSWEMSSQNWSGAFCDEFRKRRGYNPQPYYPAYMGLVVESVEQTERFLWDMRKTSQELVLENHAGTIKKIAHKHGLNYSNEPYDMNPAGNMDLGSVSDVIGCEFWNANGGPDTQYSCIEAVSIAHTMGKSKVFAEAFTTSGMRYLNYPGNMKNQTDWAFAMGINSIIFHTFQHQPLGDNAIPGMTMGPYGVQWHRNRPMWQMFGAYHEYLARCSHLLRQGQAVADILYLTPEGAPHIFTAPESALAGSPRLKDKKGYNFDAVTPRILKMRAKVKDGKITFLKGTRYSVLVLPNVDTMTPDTLETITKLVKAGATVIGNPPRKSPSLVGYPKCDDRLQELVEKLWGKTLSPERKVGRGRIILHKEFTADKVRDTVDTHLLPNVGNWIWFNKGTPAHSADPGDVHFRHTFEISDVELLVKAKIEATADNSLTLKINGRKVLSGDNFNTVDSADILAALCKGSNTVTAVALNAGSSANPAGFIAAMHLGYSDGTSKVIATDSNWQTSLDGVTWCSAKKLGPGTMSPWNLKAPKEALSIYPEYEVTAAVLKDMGIAEDFASTGPVRYGHRRTTGQEMYFVSNTSDELINVDCRFRVAGAKPQLWNPVTGQMRSLQQYTVEHGLTTIPMQFNPHQSFFVIFNKKTPAGQRAVTARVDFPESKQVKAIEGSWSVSFDPKWGGPAKITFDKLTDWTTHTDRGIKYYSGIATYRKAFDLPQGLGGRDQGSRFREQGPGVGGQGSEGRFYLDLGTVHDMARVTLNGKDLGVIWCAPWHVDITDVVKADNNELEIEIANRWPNRMLGDTQPPDKDVRTVQWESGLLGGKAYKTGRYTFSTSSGPGKLLASGLLGPVQILVSQD